ncbi:uncharacterized protein DSM5745_06447 [Aspergillus mulundensis]|uniref:Zn(2)-C6 fungal-type domain-containing protein n=1 Tax=Aspergillus mulundensis TaxID=1810919 RepID=A0A3D8RR32_9EURO|nr:hypothetical protein DSM5745_06447 [Aspergillus mulundensis]RDW76455.1 hypothetical protein DSM5745_06447 [Aspergillus mulundensis]
MGDPAAGPLKLRSTCDRCAALKVRCGKGKPRCERCHASGTDCIYRPYRWKTNSSSPLVQGQVPGIPIIYPQIPADDSLTSDTAFSGFSEAHLTSPASASSVFGSALPDLSHFDFSADQGAPTELSEPGAMDPPLFAELRHEELGIITPSTEGDSITLTPTHECSCADTALGIAEELYRGSLCTPTGSPPSALILKVSRAAVRSLEQLLVQGEGQCTCSHDPSLLFMFASIISKSLDWYRVVFNGICRPAKPDAAAGFMATAPLQFGDFMLNSEEQRRMEAQFLLCELQSLRRMLGILGKNATVQRHGGGGLVDQLHGVLSAALDRLMTNVNSFCVFKLPTGDRG